MIHTTRGAVLALLASALLLTGCSAAPAAAPTNGRPDPGATAAPGASDNRVILYSGRAESLIQPLLADFTAQTGITVEVRYAGTAELAAQLVEEGARTPAHLFLAQDAGALGVLTKQQLTTTMPDSITRLVPARYRDDAGRWVGVTGRSRVLAYDSRALTPAQLPASVFDLTKPEWKGKVGIAPTNASFQSFVTAMRVLHGDAKTAEFLAALKANDPQLRERNGVIVGDIEAGAYPLGLVNHYYLFEKAKELGRDPGTLHTRLSFFGAGDVGALVNISGVALTRNQPDADAQALVEHLLSPAGQAYFAEKTFEYPLVAGVAGPAGVPALGELKGPDVDLNDLDALQRSIELIKDAGLA
nr:iron ABC transporter substrate-binding protein [Propionibacterium sp.]